MKKFNNLILILILLLSIAAGIFLPKMLSILKGFEVYLICGILCLCLAIYSLILKRKEAKSKEEKKIEENEKSS